MYGNSKIAAAKGTLEAFLRETDLAPTPQNPDDFIHVFGLIMGIVDGYTQHRFADKTKPFSDAIKALLRNSERLPPTPLRNMVGIVDQLAPQMRTDASRLQVEARTASVLEDEYYGAEANALMNRYATGRERTDWVQDLCDEMHLARLPYQERSGDEAQQEISDIRNRLKELLREHRPWKEEELADIARVKNDVARETRRDAKLIGKFAETLRQMAKDLHIEVSPRGRK